MSVPVDADAPPPGPDPASERARATAPTLAPALAAREVATRICPYLTSEGGAWRSAVPSRDHRCGAVEPSAPQATEKQRRHCLSADHVECSVFRAARAARATSLVAGLDPEAVDHLDDRRRAIARTAPVVLEPPRLVDQVTRLQLDRAPGQVALIGLMLVAFAVVAIARLSAGSAAADPSAIPSFVPVASHTPAPSSTRAPEPSGSAGPAASVGPSGDPSFSTTYTVKKGDTLVGVANRFKTTAAKIRALNGLKSNTLNVGQVLKIP